MSTPVRKAARDTRAGAPEKTLLPPITSKRPKSPLCALLDLGFFARITSPGPANWAILSGKPISFTSSSPTYFLATCKPLFTLWKVMVTSAFTALPNTFPVSDSTPVGISTAILKAGIEFM